MAGIYIHIPFCKKLCSYCDFYHVISPSDFEPFMNALLREAELRKEYAGNEIISTVYIGGGTPSVLSVHDITLILGRISKLYVVDEKAEITIELNPDDINTDYLHDLKNTGINRISLGVQSWRDSDLIILNRRHNSALASEALNEIMNTGFENVSVDLIYGIPGMNAKDWSSNLDITFSYAIQHLSAYHLTIEKGTVLEKMKEREAIREIDEEESVVQFNMLIDKAQEAGFIQYEISNFGKPGFLSIHNTNYWKQVNYIGLGPSAHSFNGYSRQWNVRNLKSYIKALNSGEAFYEKEELDSRTRFNEYIMTSLRTMWGIDLEFVEAVFEKEGYDYIVNIAGKLIAYGLMKQDEKNLVLTNQGKMISDNVISELMLPENN